MLHLGLIFGTFRVFVTFSVVVPFSSDTSRHRMISNLKSDRFTGSTGRLVHLFDIKLKNITRHHSAVSNMYHSEQPTMNNAD